MASAKDIYEAKVYAANMYAAGVFRGVGVGIVQQFRCGQSGVTHPYSGFAGSSPSYPGQAGNEHPYSGIADTNPC